LRKKDLIWILGSRKGKSNRQDKEAAAGIGEFGSKGRFIWLVRRLRNLESNPKNL